MISSARCLGILALITSAWVLPPAVVQAAPVSVRIASTATLVGSGEAVDVDVTVRCPKGWEVLEAFVYVTQDGNQSDFGSIPLTCSGRARTYRVRVGAFETSFHRGSAFSSAYILLVHSPQARTAQGQDSRTIQIV